MAYTNDPANDLSDRVRFYVSDTNVSSPQLSDEEIAFLLEDEGQNARRAAARAAEALAAKYSGIAEERRVGPLMIRSMFDRSKKYAALAKSLWAAAQVDNSAPIAGGINSPSFFTRRMQEYPLGEIDRVARGEDTAHNGS